MNMENRVRKLEKREAGEGRGAHDIRGGDGPFQGSERYLKSSPLPLAIAVRQLPWTHSRSATYPDSKSCMV